MSALFQFPVRPVDSDHAECETYCRCFRISEVVPISTSGTQLHALSTPITPSVGELVHSHPPRLTQPSTLHGVVSVQAK